MPPRPRPPPPGCPGGAVGGGVWGTACAAGMPATSVSSKSLIAKDRMARLFERGRLGLPPLVVAQAQRLHRVEVLPLVNGVRSLVWLRDAQEQRVLAVVVGIAAGVGLLRHQDVSDVGGLAVAATLH